MLQTEILENSLIRHYSDQNKKIKQIETGILYDEAIDIMPCRYTYEESDVDIEPEIIEEN